MPHPRVVHCKRDSYDVLIDRTTKWGNPFRIEPDGDRDAVLDLYAEWLTTQGRLMKAIRKGELQRKILGCWCAPNPCHGEILIALDEQRLDLGEYFNELTD